MIFNGERGRRKSAAFMETTRERKTNERVVLASDFRSSSLRSVIIKTHTHSRLKKV